MSRRLRLVLSLCVLVVPAVFAAHRRSSGDASSAVRAQAPAAAWQGFADKSAELRTDRFDFAAGGCNCNYYDGDFGDMDGDGYIDRALYSKYHFLWNSDDGVMLPARSQVNFLGSQMHDAAQWADVDNDGDLDLVSAGNGEGINVQINAGGRFIRRDAYSGSGLQIVSTDVNKDGFVDLVVVSDFGGNSTDFRLLVNDGHGKFTEQAAARGLPFKTDFIGGAVSGDVDGDGDFDIVLQDFVRNKLILARNDGTGHFTTTEFGECLTRGQYGAFQQSMNLGDIDDDGDLDLVIGGAEQTGKQHHVYVNDGSGNFTLKQVLPYSGDNAKLVDVDHDGDLDFIAFSRVAGQPMHLQVFLNDGTGSFTYDPAHSVFFGIPNMNNFGDDLDVTDLDRDGTYDVWVGLAGERVHTMINTYQDPSGLPADLPRNVQVVSADAQGIAISWQAPPFADSARRYKVYRTTTPGLLETDRLLVKEVAISRHTDEGFSAGINRHTTTAYLGDPDVVLDGSTQTVQWIDRSAQPGITYYYSVAHVGTENTVSEPTDELAARIEPAGAPDAVAPYLQIVGPKSQEWSVEPRMVLYYGDGGSGIDLSSLRVSINQPLGTGNPSTGGRAAGADISDLLFRKDGGAWIYTLPPSLKLPLIKTPSTLTASVADMAGHVTIREVSFTPIKAASKPPVAVLDASVSIGPPPLTVEFSAARSTDSDGLIFRYEWLFGDDATSHDREEDHTYTLPGTYTATLVVRDNDGGVGIATKTIVVASGTPPAVNAGPDQAITLPASAALDGTVTDDGLPNPPGTVTTSWTKVSGPGTVAFGNPAAVDTSASFSASGTYVLRLSAFDGALSASDDVAIAVNPQGLTGFNDAFDRPDSTVLGNGWTETSGDFTIASGEMRNAAINATHMAVLPALSGAKQTIAASFASSDNNGSPRFGLFLRYQDTKNFYLVSRATGGSSQLRVSRVVNGVETLLGSASISNPARNVFFRLEGAADGTTLQLKIDGVLKVSVSDSAFASGSPGVFLATPSAAASHHIDNISATVQ